MCRGRDAIGQFQEGPEPGLLLFAEFFDPFPVVHAADGGQDGDEDDVEKDVPLSSDLARIRQGGQMIGKALGFGFHGRNAPQNVLPQTP